MPDYDFYTETYKGNCIKEGDFERLALRADTVVDGYERAYTISYPAPQSRDMAVCAVAEELHRTVQAAALEASQAGVVTSVAVGSVSTTYSRVPAEAVERSEAKRKWRAFCQYADVYRGVKRC